MRDTDQTAFVVMRLSSRCRPLPGAKFQNISVQYESDFDFTYFYMYKVVPPSYEMIYKFKGTTWE